MELEEVLPLLGAEAVIEHRYPDFELKESWTRIMDGR
jgi:hypothetical protein